MIKIIEHGTIKETRCIKCGCLFSYEDVDIQTGYERELYKKPFKFIRCPQCMEEIVLEATK